MHRHLNPLISQVVGVRPVGGLKSYFGEGGWIESRRRMPICGAVGLQDAAERRSERFLISRQLILDNAPQGLWRTLRVEVTLELPAIVQQRRFVQTCR
jgi:hypothetical protein